MQSFLDEFWRRFDCSDPEWVVEGKSVSFCGLKVTVQAGGFRVHQDSYARVVLAWRGVSQTTSAMKPGVGAVREAEAEILWLSGYTRPDLTHASSIMSQFAVRR